MWLSQGVIVPEQAKKRPPSLEASMFCERASRAAATKRG
jgi:hypothetical protein